MLAGSASGGLSLVGLGNLPQAGWQSRKCSVCHQFAPHKIPSTNGNCDNPQPWWIIDVFQKLVSRHLFAEWDCWREPEPWITLKDVVVRMALCLVRISVTQQVCSREVQCGPALPPIFGFVNPNPGGGGWVGTFPTTCQVLLDMGWINLTNKYYKKGTNLFSSITQFFLLLGVCIPGTSSGSLDLNQLTNLEEN